MQLRKEGQKSGFMKKVKREQKRKICGNWGGDKGSK